MKRSISRVVPAKSTFGGMGRRFVGSTDLMGQGTEFPIADIGPYIMVEEGRGIVGPGNPPIGLHPHAGLIAISYVPRGDRWTSLSNLPGSEEVNFAAGDVLLTRIGRGGIHCEESAGEGEHELFQLVLRLPASHREVPSQITVVRPKKLEPGVLQLVNRDSLAGTGLDVTLTHCTIPSKGTVELAVPPSHSIGFLYVHSGELQIGDQTVQSEHMAVLSSEGSSLELASSREAGCQVYVGTAVPVDDEWVKLLGHNGFVVAADKASAEAKLEEYAADPASFGV